MCYLEISCGNKNISSNVQVGNLAFGLTLLSGLKHNYFVFLSTFWGDGAKALVPLIF